ncbi:hypothetical protein DESC_590109 [Desulfosarcina cetonica]|nr:hypothetical protein DESC_590109 [Desulfosarcina cetonica]
MKMSIGNWLRRRITALGPMPILKRPEAAVVPDAFLEFGVDGSQKFEVLLFPVGQPLIEFFLFRILGALRPAGVQGDGALFHQHGRRDGRRFEIGRGNPPLDLRGQHVLGEGSRIGRIRGAEPTGFLDRLVLIGKDLDVLDLLIGHGFEKPLHIRVGSLAGRHAVECFAAFLQQNGVFKNIQGAVLRHRFLLGDFNHAQLYAPAAGIMDTPCFLGEPKSP